MKIRTWTGQNHSRVATVGLVLLVSFILRLLLILRGGQYYFPDEIRFENPLGTAQFMLKGDFSQAFQVLFSGFEHVGFRIIAVLPALLGVIIGSETIFPAIFLCLFSVINLFLIWKLADHAGASSEVAWYALIFAALSQSLLYYSRHLLPYDTSMTFGLSAVLFAFRNPANPRSLFLCGTFMVLCFLTYNGYWSLAFFAGMLLILRNRGGYHAFLHQGAIVGIGFLVPIGILAYVASLFDKNLFSEFYAFSATINQGEFSEGWTLPWEYFWQVERFYFIILLFFCICSLMAGRNNSSSHYLFWILGILIITVSLGIPSVYFERIVVYGRLARQLMPFLALSAACGLEAITQRRWLGRTGVVIILCMCLCQAMWNYSKSFILVYPRNFVVTVSKILPSFQFSQKRFNTGAPPLCRSGNYVAQNLKYLFPLPEAAPEIDGKPLLSIPHPINFPPYQYEGLTSEQRKLFRREGVTMTLLEVDDEFIANNLDLWMSIKNCVVPKP